MARPEVWLCAAVAAFVAGLGVIGADALWLVPLGERVAHGHLPSSIPYATAPTSGWHDVPAGGELVFWAAYRAFGGDRGLLVLQTAAATVGIAALTRGLAREAPRGGVLVTGVLVVVGALPAVAVANISLFSFALFPVLLALLESESVRPSRRVWAAVPLLAVWGNLHGAVLIGWALLACYLGFGRARRSPAEAFAVLAAATIALFLNPVLWNTPRYYWSVFRNAAARDHAGLWGHLSAAPLDVSLIVVFTVFVALAFRQRRRIRPWEGVAAAGLAIATVDVARNGVWLLMVAAYPAARALNFHGPRPRLMGVVATALVAGALASLVRAPPDPGSRALAREAGQGGRTVLAEPILGQQVALEGGRVWVDNPLDAFREADQRLYVDWFSGRTAGASAVEHGAVIFVRARSAAGRAAANDRRLVLLTARDGAALYRVKRASRH